MIRHEPDCDDNERYVLRIKIGKLFVARTTPFETTEKPEQARQFSGLYLNTTKWDWTHDCEALPIKKLKLALKGSQNALKSSETRPKDKGDTKSQQTSKRR